MGLSGSCDLSIIWLEKGNILCFGYFLIGISGFYLLVLCCCWFYGLHIFCFLMKMKGYVALFQLLFHIMLMSLFWFSPFNSSTDSLMTLSCVSFNL